MGYYTNNEMKEYQRQYVERLLDSELSVPEWCKRNGIKKTTMYRWLTTFAETEPELFGGTQNITGRTKRRWMETTKAKIRSSKALATTTPVPVNTPEKRQAPGVIIVDTLFAKPVEETPVSKQSAGAGDIVVKLNGASITIPSGCYQADIISVLEAVKRL